MTDIETKKEQAVETKPSDSFFVDRGNPKKDEKHEASSKEYEIRNSEFVGKSSNRKLDSSIEYNIHFTLGCSTFTNIIGFISEVNYNVAFCFRKREVQIISIDEGDAHGAIVRLDKIEFSDYGIKGLEKDDEEKWILIDTSIITDDMSFNEEKPVDFYVDTINKNRFYVINGKEQVERQLNSIKTSDADDALLKKHKSFYSVIQRLTKDERYQKTVVNYSPFTGVLKSLSKKTDKQKDASTLCTLHLTKYDLDFRIENETKSSSIMLSSDDIMVYPLRNDTFKFNLKFLNKLGKFKLNNVVDAYVSGSLPIIFSSRMGGGGAQMWYLLAPRIDSD